VFPIPRNGNGQINSAEESEKPSGRQEGALLPKTIRSEVNFLVFPFFALWDKDVRKKTVTEYKTVVIRGAQKLEVAWTVSSNPRYGYPGPFDREVHKAIEQIISELPLPIQNPIPLGSLYGLYKRMSVKKIGGSQYKKIKEVLKRITSATIESEGTFYDKQRKRWIEDVFHLYDRIIFKGEELSNGGIADNNYLYLGSWYLDNINANYVKPIDWNYYRALGTSIAQRLYELLSIKFYGLIKKKGKSISYRYSTICDLLPITRQRYFSDARNILDPAHKKLRDTGFFENWDWEELPQEGTEKDWLIRYYPGRRAREEIERFKVGGQLEFELPPHVEKETAEDGTELSVEESSIAEQLIQRGITRSTARNLVKNYPTEQIGRQVEVFDWLKERKGSLIGKNPAGFLRKSIEENYQFPKEYLVHREREARERKEKGRRELWLQHRKELIKQGVTDWDKTPPEERVKGRLDFWIAMRKLTRPGPTPTPVEIEANRQELIDNLPKTDEEKWEYIARNYPEEPPGNFE